MTKSTKCAVKDCENHEHEGKFVGLLCSPCHTFVAGDGGLYSQAYRNSREMIDVAVKMEREKPTHPNLEQVLNSAGFYRKREWEGLTLEDIQDLNASKDWIAGAKWAATLLWEKNNAKT